VRKQRTPPCENEALPVKSLTPFGKYQFITASKQLD
jgi:hypothetical protein